MFLSTKEYWNINLDIILFHKLFYELKYWFFSILAKFKTKIWHLFVCDVIIVKVWGEVTFPF